LLRVASLRLVVLTLSVATFAAGNDLFHPFEEVRHVHLAQICRVCHAVSQIHLVGTAIVTGWFAALNSFSEFLSPLQISNLLQLLNTPLLAVLLAKFRQERS